MQPTLLAILGLALVAVPAGADLTVGSFDALRVGESTLNGSDMTATRAKLGNAANFGIGGTVDTAIDILDVSAPLTEGVLAPFDVFFHGNVNNSILSAAELTALREWVIGGGRLLLACDGFGYDNTCLFFGRSFGGNAVSPTTPAAGQSANTPFTGPFGTASSIPMSGERSFFATSSGTTLLGVDAVGDPTLLFESLGAGEVLYLGDVDMLSNHTLTAGAAISSADGNDVLLGNILAAFVTGGCPEGALCLRDERFQVTVTWETRAGARGVGHPVQLTSDSGYFWFFDEANVEMIVKVLDGCPVNDHYWVFAGGLTNVEVRTRVTDTETGAVKVYSNPQRTPFQPLQDTGAFETCP